MPKSKRTREAKLTAIGITQQFDEKYWSYGAGLSQEERNALNEAQHNDNIVPLTDCIVARLNNAGYTVAECHAIIHNQDTQMEWSELEKKEVVAYKVHHGHWVVKFQTNKGGTLTDLAQAVGVERQFIEKPASGRYAYDNMLAYLVHAKYADKFQYATDLVYTAVGTLYKDHVKERWTAWMKGRGHVEKKKAVEGIDDLEYMILTGRVTKSQVLLTDELFAIYSRNKRRCLDAFDSYGERKAAMTLKSLSAGEFRLAVYFITGQAGLGKSYFAKHFISALIEESAKRFGDEGRWRVYSSAATNPLDDYCGEEIMLMDDVRGGAMRAEDWLKLLDPVNASPGSARYHNKMMACRTIVITSSKEPLEFFYYARACGGERSEFMDQFLRRLMSMVTVIPYEENCPLYAIADSILEQSPHDVTLEWLPEQWTGSRTEKPKLSLRSRFKPYAPLDADQVFGLDEAIGLLVDKTMAAHGFPVEQERFHELMEKIGPALEQAYKDDLPDSDSVG